MDFSTHLGSQRAEVVSDWQSQVFSLYGEESKKILKRKKAEYLNPMGSKLSDSFEQLFECLITQAPKDALDPLLETVVRFGAVQEGPPSSSLNFLFILKKVLLKEIEKVGADESSQATLNYVDRMIKFAVDHLVASRELIATLKVEEMERKTYSLIKLLNSQSPTINQGEA